MEILDYDRKFLKAFRIYLKENFADVNTGYRYRNYTSHKGRITAKRGKGIILTAQNNDCSMQFEMWGGTTMVEATFVFGKDEKRKFFRSHLEIGTGNFGEFLVEEFDFINKVLSKASTTGNNALDFIMRFT